MITFASLLQRITTSLVGAVALVFCVALSTPAHADAFWSTVPVEGCLCLYGPVTAAGNGPYACCCTDCPGSTAPGGNTNATYQQFFAEVNGDLTGTGNDLANALTDLVHGLRKANFAEKSAATKYARYIKDFRSFSRKMQKVGSRKTAPLESLTGGMCEYSEWVYSGVAYRQAAGEKSVLGGMATYEAPFTDLFHYAVQGLSRDPAPAVTAVVDEYVAGVRGYLQGARRLATLSAELAKNCDEGIKGAAISTDYLASTTMDMMKAEVDATDETLARTFDLDGAIASLPTSETKSALSRLRNGGEQDCDGQGCKTRKWCSTRDRILDAAKSVVLAAQAHDAALIRYHDVTRYNLLLLSDL